MTVYVTCRLKCLRVSNILLIMYHILDIQLQTPHVYFGMSVRSQCHVAVLWTANR
jgi:hypothetical protein